MYKWLVVRLKGNELRAKLRKQERNYPLKPRKSPPRVPQERTWTCCYNMRERQAHLPNACVELQNSTMAPLLCLNNRFFSKGKSRRPTPKSEMFLVWVEET